MDPVTATRVLAPNPGPMTLDGTNSWVLTAGDAGERAKGSIVVDPGPNDDEHVNALAETHPALILITHRHADHTDAAAALHALTGAPVRAVDVRHCLDGEPLANDEVIDEVGVRIVVVPAPGHTDDSVGFWVAGVGEHGAMLTGDSILGRGSTVIMHPDGSVAAFLDTLDRFEEYGDAAVLPGHGDTLPSLAKVAAAYREHRLDRLRQVERALDDLGQDATVEAVTDVVYGDTDPAIRYAAEASMRAQLDFLR